MGIRHSRRPDLQKVWKPEYERRPSLVRQLWTTLSDMTEEPIDYDELQRLWNAADRHVNCENHKDAVSVDEYGVFHISCRSCGRFGFADEDGARSLGWIE